MAEAEMKGCDQMRLLIDRQQEEPAQPLTEEEQARVAEHTAVCRSCRTWQEQMTELAACARNLPQFDVPQILTAQIMAQVEQESSSPVAVMPLAVAALVAVVLVIGPEALETLSGLGSWAVGLAVLVGFKLLIEPPARPLAR